MYSNFGELHSDSEPLGAVSGFVNEFIEVVRHRQAFAGFSHSETLQLTQYFECFGVPRDTAVLSEGDQGDFLLIFLTGEAVIVRGQASQAHILRVVKPGDMVGAISFFDGLARTASCNTTQPSDIAVLSRENFQSLLATHPRLANKFLLVLLKQNVSTLRQQIDGRFPHGVV
jgi:CRP/FNR family cyclic AMP-dependent transcriptional regulator